MMQVNKWHNCYDESWKDVIVPEAFAHPAKMSYGLLSRILSHAQEQGWLAPQSIILEPFGGIGSTGILGAYEGYQVVCVELEDKFVKLAEQNFKLHDNAWRKFGNPRPIVIQGDNRRLVELVEKANVIISSPPYADSEHNYKHGLKVLGDNFKGRKAWETKGGTVEKADCIVSSPPFQESLNSQDIDFIRNRLTTGPAGSTKLRGKSGAKSDGQIYGQTPGQLGAMKPGKADLVVSSPPYSSEGLGHGGKPNEIDIKKKLHGRISGANYGQTPGQLGAMPAGDLIISSPPYAESLKPETEYQTQRKQERIAKSKTIHDGRKLEKPSPGKAGLGGGYGNSKGNLGNLKSGDVDAIISSPPYSEAHRAKQSPGGICDKNRKDLRKAVWTKGTQGDNPENLGNLKSGDVDCVISSPPYTNQDVAYIKSNMGEAHKKMGTVGHRNQDDKYGQTKGNLGNLKPGDVDCVISSPPWEKQEGSMQSKKFKEGSAKMLSDRNAEGKTKGHYATPAARKRAMDKANQQEYGNSKGQLGQEQGETFWGSAKTILEQCHKILKPGGHAIFVLKAFVRKGRIVDFPGDWRRLCESVGFKTVCIHHAMLVKETEHKTLFGDTEVKRKERKSFFRRLAESKGSPRIDYEVVLCMRK